MTDEKMSPERELEEQLKEAGNKLLQPPTPLDELLPLLDQVENLLSRVEQSPAKSMQSALSPLTSALVMDELLRHSNVDVKVAVASCISEITRITAPDAPYDDDKMKDVFQLIVSSFEDLSDESSRSYTKRAMILETVAKVRSCVVMLDLECDGLLAEMFTHFLGTIRDHHSENVFSSMETIMTLVLDESEDISSEILTPLLACMRKDNQDVLPVAVKLAEKVIEKCATKLKPYLSQAIRSLGMPLDDYNEVVTTVCEGPSSTVEHINENASTEQLVEKNVNEASSTDVEHNVPRPSNLMMINGGNNKGNDDDRKDAEVNTKENDNCDEPSADMLVSKSDDDDSETHKPLKFDSKLEDVDMIRGTKPNSSMNVSESSDTSHVDGEKEVDNQLDAQEIIEKDLHGSSREDDAVDASKSSEIEIVKNLSAPEASETDVVAPASPSQSGSLYDENRPKKAGRLKNKESSLQEETPSQDFVSNKASEGTHDSEAKQHRRSGKKAAAQTAKKEKVSAEVDTSKDESGGASDLEIKQVKHLGKKVDENSSTMDGHSSKRNMKSKRRRHGKDTSENEVTKSSAEDDLKKTSAMKSFSKLAKRESSPEENPRMSSKRKRASSQHKGTEDVAYGDNLLGAKVKVWWPQDRQFYEGVIDSFDPAKKKHKVLYNDGDEEILNLRKERWEIINDEVHSTETASPEAASGMQKRDKAKFNAELVKQGKADVSPKSKSKGTSTKNARKTDDEPKLKDRTPKSGCKTDDDSSVGSKSHSQRIGGKHVDNSSKASLKSKDADSGISKGKSKQDSPKTGSKSKQDASRIGSKSKQDTTKTGMKSKSKTPEAVDDDNANGMGKIKFSASKTKETGELKEKIKGKPTDVPKTPEGAKVKSSEMSKVQESEAGSTKKRRRTG